MAQPMPDSAVDRSRQPKTEEPKTEAPFSHKPPTRLILVRHAVTAHTGPLLSGRMPGVDLSEKGVGQAEAAATRLAALPIAAVYASPIERTTQTARRIAGYPHAGRARRSGCDRSRLRRRGPAARSPDLAETDEWKGGADRAVTSSVPGGESIRAMQVCA